MHPSVFLLLLASLAPQGPTPDEAAALAAEQRPKPRQLAWQELGFTCFVHFGVNTFTGAEWGTGKEDPALFQPGALDTDQWCRVARDAGMRLVMITAKHHDGFCLFPSDYTEHDVAASPWRDGRGDVVGDLATSCAKFGLRLGVYLSPADLAEIEGARGRYGNGSAAVPSVIPGPVPGRARPERTFTYEVDDYNRYFLNQLHELLTRYGPVHEVWFDGANPKPGTGQTYAYEAWYDLIRQLAPEAAIAIKGPDVRWCGNEAGRVRDEEWSVVAVPDLAGGARFPDLQAADLGSRAKLAADLAEGRQLHWWPSEVNTSIRHGWFWRDEAQPVRSANELLDIWYGAVGGNAVFLLNVPPNRDGLFAPRDVAVLSEVGRRLAATFGTDLAADGDLRGFREDGMSVRELQLPEARLFNRVDMGEDIARAGQRIESGILEAWLDDDWREVARVRTVGFRRILKLPELRTDRLRLWVLRSRGGFQLSHWRLHHELPPLAAPTVFRDARGALEFVCDPPASTIRYTLDGSEPTATSALYRRPVPFVAGGQVRVRAFDAAGRAGPVAEAHFDLASVGWSLHGVSSEEPGAESARFAIDGDPRTLWHTRWSSDVPRHPHWIAIDFGHELELTGFSYLPRQDSPNGTVAEYSLELSSDGEAWSEVARGRFGNVLANPVRQDVRLTAPRTARFMKFMAHSSAAGDTWASAAEIGVLTDR